MCEINWDILLEFTKVFFSAPPMAAFISALVVLLFRKEIAQKIIELTEAPGTKFVTPQPPPPKENRFSEPPKVEITGQGNSGQAQTIDAKSHDSFQSGQTSVIDASRIPESLKDDPIAIDEIKKAMDDPYSYVAEFKRISISLNYERIFQWIYGTQVKLLQHLANTADARSLHELNNFYGEHVSLGNANKKMPAYFEFLESWGLITVDKNGVKKAYRITEYGKDFLAYIADQYPDNWHNRPN